MSRFDDLTAMQAIPTLYQYLYLKPGINAVVFNLGSGDTVMTMDEKMNIWFEDLNKEGTHEDYPYCNRNLQDIPTILQIIDFLKHDQRYVQTHDGNGAPIFGSRWAEILYTMSLQETWQEVREEKYKTNSR